MFFPYLIELVSHQSHFWVIWLKGESCSYREEFWNRKKKDNFRFKQNFECGTVSYLLFNSDVPYDFMVFAWTQQLPRRGLLCVSFTERW